MKKESNELYSYHRHYIIFLVPFGVCLHGSWTLTADLLQVTGHWRFVGSCKL